VQRKVGPAPAAVPTLSSGSPGILADAAEPPCLSLSFFIVH